MIKAIETRYKGCRFRSRLEARWAVFFDTLGIDWEYEKEGYDLNGEWYLPDFWLPLFETFVEIKPNEFDLVKPTLLFKAGARVMVLCGNPWPWDYYSWTGIGSTLVPQPTLQFSQLLKHFPLEIMSLCA